MTRRQRLVNLGIAAVIAIVAVVVILATSGGSDDGERETAATPAPTEQPEARPQEDATASPSPKPKEPPVPSVEVKDGKVVGGIAKFRIEQGDRLRFTVASDVPEEIHVHAYDIYEDVGPGQKAKFDFKADITGVIEVELHGSGLEIASIRVDP